jgi:hypothetical protein
MDIYKWLQNLLHFLKHSGSLVIVTKFYPKMYNNKEGDKRLNKNGSNCICFRKNLLYDAIFAAANFFLKDETRFAFA